jgi:hypothetical protein
MQSLLRTNVTMPDIIHLADSSIQSNNAHVSGIKIVDATPATLEIVRSASMGWTRFQTTAWIELNTTSPMASPCIIHEFLLLSLSAES